MNNYEKELWKTNKKAWLNYKYEQTKTWICENPETAIMIASIVASTVAGIGKSYSSYKRSNEDKIHRERDIYDRKHGYYYRMKRVPSPKEREEIIRRKNEGQDYYDILNDLRLLESIRF